MNILGMGPLELLLIIVLALIVFGPAKLPEIMGQVGKAINDFRRATSDLSEEFNRTIQAELQETKSAVEEAKSVMTDAKSAVSDVHSSVTSAVTGMPAPARVGEPGAALPAAIGTSAEPRNEATANGAVPAEGQAKPPLADTAQWSWETSPVTSAASASAEPSGSPTAEATTPEAAPAEGTNPSNAPAPPDPATPDAETPPPKPAARDELAPPY